MRVKDAIKRNGDNNQEYYIEVVFLRYNFVKERLEYYENNYNEETDKLNRIMYEHEFIDLYKKFQKPHYQKYLKKFNLEL